MTLYDLTNNTTVQGNIILDGFYDNGTASTTVIIEQNVDDLASRIPDAIEDCEVTYLFCDRDGWMHIEFNAPERLRVSEFWADKWTNEAIEEDDCGLTVEFRELTRLSDEWGVEVCELLDQCEEL